MKNKSRIISILLAMLMVLSSFGAVFAEGEEAPQAPAGDTELTDELTQDETVPEEVTEPEVTGEEEDALPEEPEEEAAEEETAPEEEPEALSSDAPAASNEDAVMVNVTVNYVYKNSSVHEDGDQAHAPVTGEYSVGSVIKSPAITCYKADKASVTVSANQPVVTVSYSPAAPAKVTNLKLHPSYKSIILTWKKVPGASKYIVQKSKDNKSFTTVTSGTYLKSDDTAQKKWRDTKVGVDKNHFSTAVKYYYRVYAVSKEGKKSPVSVVRSGSMVRPMYEQVTFKSSAQLTSHDGKNKTITFSGGQTIIAQGFGGGKYKFYYKGYYFYANYVRVYKCKPLYQKNTDGAVSPTARKLVKYKYPTWKKQDYAQNGLTSYKKIRYYDKTTAEDFVNCNEFVKDHGRASSKKYLIWVSTYTQHLYIFKRTDGKWKLHKDWECSTGAAGSPTPTGFGKKLVDRWYTHSGIKYWNPFQNANSIHGHRLSYVFGKPQSNGCVRNYDPNAKWIYDYVNAKGGSGAGLIVY